MNTRDRLLDRSDVAVLRGLRILILEDELLVALETKATIRGLGGIVVGPYARVDTALQAIQEHALDGAILDINVAGVQSFAVADALQARRVPFAFCTSYGQDIVPPRFQTAAIVEKPFDPENLAEALAKAVRRASAAARS